MYSGALPCAAAICTSRSSSADRPERPVPGAVPFFCMHMVCDWGLTALPHYGLSGRTRRQIPASLVVRSRAGWSRAGICVKRQACIATQQRKGQPSHVHCSWAAASCSRDESHQALRRRVLAGDCDTRRGARVRGQSNAKGQDSRQRFDLCSRCLRFEVHGPGHDQKPRTQAYRVMPRRYLMLNVWDLGGALALSARRGQHVRSMLERHANSCSSM
jgi:hypothetical protein